MQDVATPTSDPLAPTLSDTQTADPRAVRAAQREDLKRSLGALDAADREVVFEVKKTHGDVLFYSMETGEPAYFPSWFADRIAAKRDEQGRPRFTPYQSQAPEYKQGTVKCFLHSESPERAILEEIGIVKTCPAAKLANNYSKRIHGQHRHKQEWAMYQEHLNEARQDRYEADAAEQRDAMMQLAQAAAAKAPTKKQPAE